MKSLLIISFILAIFAGSQARPNKGKRLGLQEASERAEKVKMGELWEACDNKFGMDDLYDQWYEMGPEYDNSRGDNEEDRTDYVYYQYINIDDDKMFWNVCSQLLTADYRGDYDLLWGVNYAYKKNMENFIEYKDEEEYYDSTFVDEYVNVYDFAF